MTKSMFDLLKGDCMASGGLCRNKQADTWISKDEGFEQTCWVIGAVGGF